MAEGWNDRAAPLPLRYGSYRVRLVVAVTLLYGGGIALQLTSAYTLPIAVIGFVASVAGWVVVPASGWRRCVAVAPGVFGAAALLSGAASASLVAVSIAAWLFVRRRPAVTWAVLVLPIVAGVVLGGVYTQYGAGVEVAIVMGAVSIGSTWLAALVSRRIESRRGARSEPASGPSSATSE